LVRLIGGEQATKGHDGARDGFRQRRLIGESAKYGVGKALKT